jgi:hypothetical protein
VVLKFPYLVRYSLFIDLFLVCQSAVCQSAIISHPNHPSIGTKSKKTPTLFGVLCKNAVYPKTALNLRVTDYFFDYFLPEERL